MYESRRPATVAILGGIALATSIPFVTVQPAVAQTATPHTFAVYLQDASGQKVQAPVRIEADEVRIDRHYALVFLLEGEKMAIFNKNYVWYAFQEDGEAARSWTLTDQNGDTFRIQADEATPDNYNGVSFLTGSRLVGYAQVGRVLHVIADEATGPALPGR